METKEQPKIHGLFGQNAIPVLDECLTVLKQRGSEYSDTWLLCQWFTMKAVAKSLGLELTQDQARKLTAAAFVDMKYYRLAGGYKEDSLVDLINYAANLIGEQK